MQMAAVLFDAFYLFIPAWLGMLAQGFTAALVEEHGSSSAAHVCRNETVQSAAWIFIEKVGLVAA